MSVQWVLLFAVEEVDKMPLSLFIFINVILILLTLWPAYFAIKNKRVSRPIKKVPTTAIRYAKPGFREFVGTALYHEEGPLVAPLSGRECAWYSCSVEREELREDDDGNTERTWDQIYSKQSDSAFMMEDATGCCFVDPMDADLTPSTHEGWHEHQGSFQLIGFTFRYGEKYRFSESRIHQGDPLYALGHYAADTYLMRKPKSSGYPFILTCKSQEEAIKSYESSSTLLFVIALILGALWLWFLIANIGEALQ